MDTDKEQLIQNRIRNLWENTDYVFTLFEKLTGYAIIAADFDGNIIAYNEGAHQTYGYAPHEVIGKQNIEIFFPEEFINAGKLQQAIDTLMEEGNASYEGEKVRKDGEAFPARVQFTLTKDIKESMVGFVEIVEDLTERKRWEEALTRQACELAQANTELAAVNKELEAFSHSVSHDLRAPLRSIDGFSQVLLEDYAEKLDGQGKNYLQRVRSATQRMAELIDDLLQLSRVTRAEMNRETVDLNELAQEVAGGLRESQPERQVEFVVAPGVVASGDARLLRAMLENLLGNAWKFTSSHPTARIEFGVTQRNAEDVFFIRDDGVGFDMAYADKLFGAFQRLHLSDEFPGTGIGLATVQRILHRHGGTIWAEAEVGKGATFYFTLGPGGNENGGMA